jgi:hypothetical protein
MTVWYILWSFGIVCGHLVYFPVGVCLDQEKSGNSAAWATPTIVSYNASVAVKIYNATNSIARFFLKKNYFSPKHKRSCLLQRWRCSCKFKSRRIGPKMASWVVQGCQMVCFQTKNPNLVKFWRVLLWEILVYFMTVWSILRPLEIFYGHLVYCVVFWTMENLATLA